MDWWFFGVCVWFIAGYCAYGLVRGTVVANHRFEHRMDVHDDSYLFEMKFEQDGKGYAFWMLVWGPTSLVSMAALLWLAKLPPAFKFWNPFMIFKKTYKKI